VIFLKIKSQSILLVLPVLILALTFSGCAVDNRNTRIRDEAGTQQGQNLTDNNTQRINTQNGVNPNIAAPQGFDAQNLGNDTRARLQDMQNQVGIQDTQNGLQQNATDKERSDAITTQLSNNIKELDKIAVVVEGNTALVGCTTSGAGAGAADSTTTIRSMVEEQVRQADPSISRVIVTSQPEFVNQITELARDKANAIANGTANGTNNGTINRIIGRTINRTTNDIRTRFNKIIQNIENQLS